MTKKIELGQFFTRKDIWLRPHIQNFIDTIKFNKIIDPFAGGGHLLKPFVLLTPALTSESPHLYEFILE
jgi:hypothetical protein